MKKSDLQTPCLLLDFDLLKYNVEYMAEYLKGKDVALRPHTKCHKTPIISHLQVRAGAKGIMVAKLGEAEVMAESGIQDIAIGNQIVQESKIRKLVDLNDYCAISVAVDDLEAVNRLSKISSEKDTKIRVLVEVDVGDKRCGVQSAKAAVKLAKMIDKAPGLVFEGIMGWEGMTAFIEDPEERRKKCNECYKMLIDTRDLIEKAGLEVETVSAGGTTSFNMAAEYPGMTEIEAGSYVFMDRAHRIKDVPFKSSLTVLATVTSRPCNDRAVIDAGGKTFSTIGGLPVAIGITGVEVYRLTDEHGCIKLDKPSVDLKIGDTVEFIPAYCPPTVNLHDKLYVTEEDEVKFIWNIEARGRID